MKPTLKYLILFLLVIALAPYFIICFYALPFADDFCFGWTASENISLLQKFLNQYLYWNGRYSADMLVNLHPLITGKIINYQVWIFVSLLATPVMLWYLIRFFVTDNLNALIASLLITLFYLNYQLNITEGIYWFIGIANYHLGILLFILHLIFLLQSFSREGKKKIILLATSILLLIFSIGFNEIGALLFPVFYFCMVAFNHKHRKFWITIFTVAIIASAFVFFSPGNFVRSHEFENRYDLLHSLWYASLQTVRFIGTWVLSVPFVLLSVFVISYAEKVQRKWISEIDYRIIFSFLLFTVFTGSFLPYFATGVLGQHRTINFVFFFFILFWILFLLSVSEKFMLRQKLNTLKNERVVLGLFSVSIFLIMITGNGIKMIDDFEHDSFRKYETAFYERQKAILKNPDAPIKKLTAIPYSFTVVDVREDTTWWVDKCMKKYCDKQSD